MAYQPRPVRPYAAPYESQIFNKIYQFNLLINWQMLFNVEKGTVYKVIHMSSNNF